MGDDRIVLHVPARDVPVPTSVSARAQAILSLPRVEEPDYPALDDPDGWRRMVAERDAAVMAMVGDRMSSVPADIDDAEIAGVRVFVVTPHGLPPDDRRVLLEIHGGAFVMGGGDNCRMLGARAARRVHATTYAVDYRMPPDHPYPAPLDDCVAVYRALLEQHRPEDIVVSGTSAGGGLGAAPVLRARDEGVPSPAATVLLTPAVDLTESGDSYCTNLGLDDILTRSLMPANLLYAGGHDLAHPYLAPVFGSFAEGFPPTLLASGTRDLFLSNTVRLHRALRREGIPAELHVLEAAGAGFLDQAREDKELDTEIRRFMDAHWSAGAAC